MHIRSSGEQKLSHIKEKKTININTIEREEPQQDRGRSY